MQSIKMLLLCLLLGVSAVIWQPTAVQAESVSGIRVDGGTVVRGIVPLRGTAHHPAFRKWQLDLLINGDPAQAESLKVEETPRPDDSILTHLDTTRYPNGRHQVRLRVVHTNLNYDEYFAPLVIMNQAGSESAVAPVEVEQPSVPTAAITENGVQLNDSNISGVVALHGVAQHPSFRKWQLDLLIDGDPEQAVFVDVGESALPTLGKFTDFDSALYPDGNHKIRLRVVHENLNYDEYFTAITIANGGVVAPSSEQSTTVSSLNILDNSAAPPDGLRWIEVDLSEQTLTAWQGDVQVLHTLVSTGKPETPTVKGRYRIRTMLPAQRMRGPDYDLPNVPSVMYFYAGYAIHGAYWHDNFGQVMSHGCVNMKVEEVAALYDWASIGIEIYVHD